MKATQKGAAILTAMLTVALVAALSAAALWQQWRGIEVEAAERERLQSAWILQGALDWARLILREDARANAGADHLAEPWAVPLQEARLSTFLAAGQSQNGGGQGLEEAFLSGRIADLQGRLNVRNLVQGGTPNAPTVQAFSRLFDTLRLPQGELVRLIAALRAAQSAPGTDGDSALAPLLPRTPAELAWLGLPPPVITALVPYVALLPEGSTVNLNTAPLEVVHASLAGASMADAQALLAARAQSHFRNLSDATQALGHSRATVSDTLHGVNSSYFEVSGQVRLGERTVTEHSLVRRNGLQVSVLWRERGAGSAPAPLASLQ